MRAPARKVSKPKRICPHKSASATVMDDRRAKALRTRINVPLVHNVLLWKVLLRCRRGVEICSMAEPLTGLSSVTGRVGIGSPPRLIARRGHENVRRQFDSILDELIGELWPQADGFERAQHPPILKAGLLEDEQVLHDHALPLHPLDLGHFDDP